MRAFVRLAVLLLVAAWASTGTVLGAEVERLDGPVTDRSGVLAGREDEVTDALEDVLAGYDVQVFVLFVDTTDDLNATDYADETANQNSFGGNDALVMVAVEDRTDAIWVADALGISDPELDGIIVDVLEPALQDGDFAGAAIATANALGAAATGAEPPPPPGTDEPAEPTPAAGAGGGTTTGSDESGTLAFVAVVLVILGVVLIATWWQRRRTARLEAEERDRRTGRLAREANALLIATDERIRDAQQEIGFVEAAWGEDEVGPLREAVTTARGELQAAFTIRQKLDDAEPEDPVTREQMLNQILDHLRRGQAALDRETERIERLRDLERDAQDVLAALPGRIDAIESRMPAAESAMAELSAYAESTVAPVRGNLVEATKGLAGARQAVAHGRSAIDGGDRRTAARSARTAEEGVAGATALLDAVEKLAATAKHAAGSVPDKLREARADLDAARAAIGNATSAAGHEARLAAIETAIRSAEAMTAAPRVDPVAALRAATEAHSAATETLAAVRNDAQQHARFVAALGTAIGTAEADLDRAEAFIAARRGGVGRRARTRLAESQRELETARALRDTQPERALEAARRAEALADEAYAAASGDFDQWNQGGPRWGGQQGPDVGGIILGAVLGGILSGGRRRGGGWGGSPWGSSDPFGGGGGWGGGGGHSTGGGWGGGGGGGHSRGGRW
jgi:uncharacterized membrane protein YgcG